MEITPETHFTGHKFRTLNSNFWGNLESGCVYFAAPSKLNDPFDCQIDLLKALRIAKGGAIGGGEKALEKWAAFLQTISGPAAKCGVFSLCMGDIRGQQEGLLWTHYAGDHKGVCVTYEIPYDFVNAKLVAVSPVEYGEEKLLAALRDLDLSTKLDFQRNIKPVITAYLTTKAKQWVYESEARFISFKPGPIPINRDWLRQVCFGLNTSPKDRAKVMKKVKKYGYERCRFAELVHADEGVFQLESREVHV